MQAKRVLRATMRDVRRAIAADQVDRAARSARIWSRVVAAVELGPRRHVLLFESLPTEPATADWYDWCRARGVPAYAPRVDGPDLRVVPAAGAAPGGTADLDPAGLDVVVVPGLAFTPDGRRLGQGGGHYDRFLRRLRDDCVTIGVAFAEQVVDDLPTEPHDVRLDLVVTDA